MFKQYTVITQRSSSILYCRGLPLQTSLLLLQSSIKMAATVLGRSVWLLSRIFTNHFCFPYLRCLLPSPLYCAQILYSICLDVTILVHTFTFKAHAASKGIRGDGHYLSSTLTSWVDTCLLKIHLCSFSLFQVVSLLCPLSWFLCIFTHMPQTCVCNSFCLNVCSNQVMSVYTVVLCWEFSVSCLWTLLYDLGHAR